MSVPKKVLYYERSAFIQGLRSQNKAATPSRYARAIRRSLRAHPVLRASLRQSGSDFLSAYPGLTPWATFCRPLRGWTLDTASIPFFLNQHSREKTQRGVFLQQLKRRLSRKGLEDTA